MAFDPPVVVRRAAWLGLALFALLAAACWQARGPLLFDETVSSWLFVPDVQSPARRIAAALGGQTSVNVQVAEGIALALVVFLFPRCRRLGIACLVIPPLIDGATALAKIVVNRTRLNVESGVDTVGFFPSGHAAGISTRMVALTVVIWAVTERRTIRWGIALPAIAMSLAVAGSTVVINEHYPTDAVGGLLLGASSATLLMAAAMGRRRA